MRNRAKCKVCNDVIESFHSTDLRLCKCGEISVDGGNALKCAARSWDNFLRVDDQNNEIVITIKDPEVIDDEVQANPPTKEELIKHLDDYISGFDNLPQSAKNSYVTNYDLQSFAILMLAIFKVNNSEFSPHE